MQSRLCKGHSLTLANGNLELGKEISFSASSYVSDYWDALGGGRIFLFDNVNKYADFCTAYKDVGMYN